MEKENKIALFEERQIRKVWHKNMWYFSVVDVVAALTESTIPRRYWSDLKKQLKEEGSEVYEKIVQLKMIALDGKLRDTDSANTEDLLRIIQSIPSPKAEPFKLWLAKVGYERIEEINNPELAMDRMKQIYEQKGYSKSWIEQRERGIITRHLLTDEWKTRGAKKGLEYAILTNEIYKEGFGLTAKQYKNHKQIEEHNNLRDSMTNIELALTNLGEASAVEIHNENETEGFDNLKEDMKLAGEVTRAARKKLESNINKSVVSKTNYKQLTNKQKPEIGKPKKDVS
ncbi:MAG: Bro-N domain-containing protein [Oscillospiraceae bacterium]|nr:Bro-N domain-containing protein [Oscillospiraceae bacterium]